jgi:hypothetical protein
LYVGTDNGVYVSLNKGETWHPFSEGLPNVAFHDLVIQPEANDLVLGTHGRSIYIANISMLQNSKEGEMTISEIEPIHFSPYWGDSRSQWSEVYEPSISIQFFNPKAEKITISIQTEDEIELQNYSVDAVKGVNMFDYDVTVSEKGKKALKKKDIEIPEAKNGKYYLPKGVFVINLGANKKEIIIK